MIIDDPIWGAYFSKWDVQSPSNDSDRPPPIGLLVENSKMIAFETFELQLFGKAACVA